MNIQKLNGLVELKGGNLSEMRDELLNLVERYPYSGPFRMLLAKASKQAGHLDQRKDLLSAAAHCSSRKALFDLMFAESFREKAREVHKLVELADEVSEEELVELIWHSPKDDGGDSSSDNSSSEKSDETSVREDVIEAISSTLDEEVEKWVRNDTPERKKINIFSKNLGDKIHQNSDQNSDTKLPEIPSTPDAVSMFGKWLSERAKDTNFGYPNSCLSQVERGASAIIDAFLKLEKPSIGKLKETDIPVGEWANIGLAEDPSLVTETMAKLYAKQGQIGRARKAFKMLALKYPDKSVYFAAQLKKLTKK